MNSRINILIRTFLQKISSLFFRGLFAILPLAVTLLLISTLFRAVARWLEPLHAYIQPTIIGTIPYAEFFLLLGFILLVGIVYRFILLRSLLRAVDAFFSNIPLIRPIYTSLRYLVRAFSTQDELTFQKVALIEFPRAGVYSIGFLTSKVPSALAPKPDKIFFNVYIPTTPNPTTGYFVVVPEEDIAIVDLTRQEAISLIMSGGIIQPERFSTLKDQDKNHRT